MSEAVYERIRQNPAYHRLVNRRGRFARTLAAIVLLCFYGFVMVVAFNPAALGQPLSEGGMLTKGVLAVFSMFVMFWVLTAIYVRRANGEFDAITAAVIAKAEKETAK